MLCFSFAAWGFAFTSWVVGGPCFESSTVWMPWVSHIVVMSLASLVCILLSAIKMDRCRVGYRGLPIVHRLPCWPLGFSRWWLWLFVAIQCRVGEALVPGPPVWTLGVCNPSGMSGKLSIFDYHPCDLWVVSETHLSRKGIADFRSQLRWSRSGYKYLITGHPAEHRSMASALGSWTGVALLSLHPSRRAPVTWPPLAFDSGRICATVSYCHGLWITGCTVYGTPKGGTHSNAREKTDQLLHLCVDRVLDAVGPRFVAGDWNHDLEKLTAATRLHDLGFVEIQDLHYLRTGVAQQATCRLKTRRDFLFLSPELACLFRSCRVDDNIWPDHSAVIGTFEGGQDELTRFVWPLPKPIPWEVIGSLPEQSPVSFEHPNDCNQAYRKVWEQVETSVGNIAHSKGLQIFGKFQGRAQTLAPVPHNHQRAPVKVGRNGEFQPLFLGVDLQHAQWVKQLRRVQSFARVAGSSKGGDCVDHKWHLWQAIILAPGFPASFQSWWAGLQLFVGDPSDIPSIPPSANVAWCLAGVMEREVRSFEQALIRERAKSKPRESNGISDLYRAVRRDAPKPVDLLSKHVEGTISVVDYDDCALEFSQETQWIPDVPLIVQGHQLEPIMVTPDKIWVESLPSVSVGMNVVQNHNVGSLPELFKAFSEQWNKRWAKHQDVSIDQWSTIIDFASRHFRRIHTDPLQHSCELLRATISSKKKQSARGLDGVSRADMLHLDEISLQSFLSMFSRAHQTGDWPQQALQGSVASLAKVDAPQTVSDFRPITVFSVAYRAWSSMESRHWLKALEPVLADWLCGNRQATRAMHLWREIIDQVEIAPAGFGHRHGIVFDLEKAYNTIPRVPVMALANLIGISQSTLVAWSGALSGMTRHFSIRGSLSDGLTATCGVPEGCGLSCLAMLLIDQAFHMWLVQLDQWVLPLTYVDNWEAVVSDPDAISRVFEATLEFAKSLDLTVDAKKTYTWSTCPKARQMLRQSFPVKLHCRDLGAHVVYSQQIANQTTLGRLADLNDFWAKLTRVRASYSQKMRLVKTVAWPRAFHAISAVVLGKKRFHSARAKVMQALRLDKAGANSYLQLCLDNLVTDPQCYALLETIRDYRDLGSNAEQVDRFTQIGLGTVTPPLSTVSQILCQRLHQIGLCIVQDGKVCDDFGIWDLSSTDFGEVRFRVQHAWLKVVASNIQHRPDFEGFSRVDVSSTRKDVLSRPPLCQGVLHRSLNGTTNTLDIVCRWSDGGSHLCPECHSPDSLHHRLWECPYVSDLRGCIPPDIQAYLEASPPCCFLHGWTITSSSYREWFSVLDAIPAVIPLPACDLSDVDILDLFTDGSALWPQEPRYRVASWAVVQASPFGLALRPEKSAVVAAMPLGGITQSVYRAELFAVLAAVTYAEKAGKGVRIWSDCLSVVRKFILLVAGSKRLRPNTAHYDLWCRILDKVAIIGAPLVRLIKVPAHECLDSATCDFDEWLIFHNQCVDLAAKQANVQRGERFWIRWHQHASETDLSIRSGIAIRDFISSVAQRWVQRGQSGTVSHVTMAPPRPAVVHTKKWQGTFPLTLQKSRFGRLFGAQFSTKILAWFNSLLTVDEELHWISFYHLFIHYQLTFCDAGVILRDGHWFVVTDESPCFPEQIGFKRMAKSFRLMLQQLWKDCEIQVATATVRPESQWICCHVGAVSLPVKLGIFCDVEAWLHTQLGSPAIGQGKALDRLCLT